MTLYPNLIKEALAEVRYPGTGKDLVAMEMLEIGRASCRERV